MFEQLTPDGYARTVLLDDDPGRRTRESDRYRCTSTDDDARRCQLMVGHRYNHAAMLGPASYLRWGDDGVAHAEGDDRPDWVRPEGALTWAASFPRVED